jgi:hypothetical protein
LTLPSTQIHFNLNNTSVLIKSIEKNLGNDLELPYIESKIKSVLSNYSFTFFDDISDADFLIELRAISRKGTEMYGLFTTFVDLTISVTDLSTGYEIYKNSLQDIKGVHLNYEKAGLNAFNNAANKISEIIAPELLERIQKSK